MSADNHNMAYYAKCMTGGVLACGITHAAICPLDIVKCRKQVGFQSNNTLGKPNYVQEHR